MMLPDTTHAMTLPPITGSLLCIFPDCPVTFKTQHGCTYHICTVHSQAGTPSLQWPENLGHLNLLDQVGVESKGGSERMEHPYMTGMFSVHFSVDILLRPSNSTSLWFTRELPSTWHTTTCIGDIKARDLGPLWLTRSIHPCQYCNLQNQCFSWQHQHTLWHLTTFPYWKWWTSWQSYLSVSRGNVCQSQHFFTWGCTLATYGKSLCRERLCLGSRVKADWVWHMVSRPGCCHSKDVGKSHFLWANQSKAFHRSQ